MSRRHSAPPPTPAGWTPGEGGPGPAQRIALEDAAGRHIGYFYLPQGPDLPRAVVWNSRLFVRVVTLPAECVYSETTAWPLQAVEEEPQELYP